MDVIQRLEPVIIEIERERECVCVVAHQAILRALYGYFMKIPLAVSRAASRHPGALQRHACWQLLQPNLIVAIPSATSSCRAWSHTVKVDSGGCSCTNCLSFAAPVITFHRLISL